MPRLRFVSYFIAFAISTVAFGQRPLNPPNYFAFQLPSLAAGELLEGELSTSDGQNFKDGSYLDLYSFQGMQDDLVTITVDSGEFDPFLSVYDPSGSLLATNDDYYQGAGTDAGVELRLPMAGRYLVVVSGYSQYDLGRYFIERVDSAPAAAMPTAPLPVPGVLESSITIEMPLLGSFPGGGTEYFALEITSPAFLQISMSSWEIDALLTLFAEDGEVVAQNDDFEMTSDARLFVELEPGSYVLAASSYFPGESGAYTLEVRRFVETN